MLKVIVRCVEDGGHSLFISSYIDSKTTQPPYKEVRAMNEIRVGAVFPFFNLITIQLINLKLSLRHKFKYTVGGVD